MSDGTTDKTALLAEAYRRGILPPDRAAAYEEAMRRGLVPKIEAATVAPAPDKTTRLERFGTGLVDPVHGGAQALEHALPGPVGALNRANNWLVDRGFPLARVPEGGLDQVETEREAAYQAERGENAGKFDLFRTGGQAVIPGAISARSGAGPFASGALSSAMMPVSDPEQQKDYWKTKAEETAEGAAFGKGLSVLGGAVSKAIKPTFDGAVKKLMDAGVKLTPGQLTQGAGKWLEEMGHKVPLLGYAIRKSVDDSLVSMNHAAVNETLKMAGGELPKAVPAGQEAIRFAKQWFGDKYSDVYSRIAGWRVDPDFIQDARTSVGPVMARMTDAGKKEFTDLWKNINSRLGTAGRLDGRGYQDMMQDLRTEAERYKASNVADQNRIGDALDKIRQVARNTLDRQNPNVAPELFTLDRAYAAYSRVKDAANDAFKNGGLFSTGGLLNSIGKEATRTGSRDALGLGDKFMQDFATAAHKVLPNKVPNSGTPEGLWMRDMLGGGTAGAAIWSHPGTALGIGAALAPYTSIGKDAVNAIARNGILGPVQALLDKSGTMTGNQFLQRAAAGFPSVQAMLAKGARQTANTLAPVAGAAAGSSFGAAPVNGLAPFIQPPQQPSQ